MQLRTEKGGMEELGELGGIGETKESDDDEHCEKAKRP